jgi:hypothetical protein
VEFQENDRKTERENYLALFSEKTTTPNSENRRLIRIEYLSVSSFSGLLRFTSLRSQ